MPAGRWEWWGEKEPETFMKAGLWFVFLLSLLPLSSRAGVSFDVKETERGAIMVQKLKCQDGGETVFFYLRDTVREGGVPMVTQDGCRLEVRAGERAVALEAGDIGYYASNHRFTVIHIPPMAHGAVDLAILGQLVSVMETLAGGS